MKLKLSGTGNFSVRLVQIQAGLLVDERISVKTETERIMQEGSKMRFQLGTRNIC